MSKVTVRYQAVWMVPNLLRASVAAAWGCPIARPFRILVPAP